MRINAFDTDFFYDDLAALAAAPTLPDCVVVPKVDGADQLHAAHCALEAAGQKAEGVRLIAMIESPIAMMSLPAICSASPRLDVSSVPAFICAGSLVLNALSSSAPA